VFNTQFIWQLPWQLKQYVLRYIVELGRQGVSSLRRRYSDWFFDGVAPVTRSECVVCFLSESVWCHCPPLLVVSVCSPFFPFSPLARLWVARRVCLWTALLCCVAVPGWRWGFGGGRLGERGCTVSRWVSVFYVILPCPSTASRLVDSSRQRRWARENRPAAAVPMWRIWRICKDSVRWRIVC